jgi:IPT/TIG domain
MRLRRLAMTLLVASAALLSTAAGASAVIVQVDGHTLSYEPVRKGMQPARAGTAKPMSSSPLEYHGGAVMTSNTNYALYWAPGGYAEYPSGYASGINAWFEDLAHDSGGLLNTDSILVQYKTSGGEVPAYDSHFGGALLDLDPYPANGCSAAPKCLTDEQLRTEIRGYVEAHGLPRDLQHEYFLLTPAGVESCMDAAGHQCSNGSKHPTYCAYHSYMPATGGVIVYADDPYVNGLNCDFGEEHPNGNASDSAIGGGLAHEHSESVTDPELNAWYDKRLQESADKCRTFKESSEYGAPLGQAPNGANYNQVIDGDLYWYQQEWSNQVNGCAQRELALPTITKVAPKNGTPKGGTTVTITGTAFSAPVTVHFGEASATGVIVNSPTSITATSPPGTPSSKVNVTVTTSAGTSAITKKDSYKYKAK